MTDTEAADYRAQAGIDRERACAAWVALSRKQSGISEELAATQFDEWFNRVVDEAIRIGVRMAERQDAVIPVRDCAPSRKSENRHA